jgi:hypothetical protein
MRARTLTWGGDSWRGADAAAERTDLVLWFASQDIARDERLYDELRSAYPAALIAGCSAGAQIEGEELSEGGAVAAALTFDHARVKGVELPVEADVAGCAQAVAKALTADDLKWVFVLSDGLDVDGDSLVKALVAALPPHVVLTGGMAGGRSRLDGAHAALNGPLRGGHVAAVGFYGESLKIGWGSEGGWDGFGPARSITRSDGKTLYELDGKPALDLYKTYLGEAAAQLPSSASMFPLMIRPEAGSDFAVMRAVMGVDEDAKSLSFAGEIPEGWSAQLTHGGLDRLIDGAAKAAQDAMRIIGSDGAVHDALALVVSCMGRKRVMGQRVADEVEAMGDVWRGTPVVGFYSFGEICPHGLTGRSTLHNQTVTVTVLREAA